MPTSVPYAIPIIASVTRQVRPKSVLDVGAGFGKYGFLFREYTDIWDMESVPDYDRNRWKTRIDCIEGTDAYVTPLHRYLYDEIHIGNIPDIVSQLGSYDVIVMGDVLEHFEKAAGQALLDELYARCNHSLILTFPQNCGINLDVLDNPLEAHRSSWNKKDFRRFPQLGYKLLEGYTALTVLTKPPHEQPVLAPSFAARRRHGWKGAAAWLMVKLIGANLASRFASLLLGKRVALST